MKPFIVFVTGANAGGAERMTVLYAKILRDAGFSAKLLLYQNGSTKSLVTFIPDDIPYEIVIGRQRYLVLQLAKKIHQLKPDVVFSSLYHVSLFTAFATILLNKPYKLIIRESNMPNRYKKWYVFLARWGYKRCDYLIAQTEEMRKQMIDTYKVLSEKIVTIYNPIDKQLIADKLKEHFQMNRQFDNYVAIGRVVPQKDYLMLIKAFSIVKAHNPLSRLYIVGAINEDYKKKLDIMIPCMRKL